MKPPDEMTDIELLREASVLEAILHAGPLDISHEKRVRRDQDAVKDELRQRDLFHPTLRTEVGMR